MTNRTREIESVAADLGYAESMDCSALDYIIETAKSSVMVNQKNVNLTAQVEALKDWRRLALQFDGHRMQAMCMLKSVAAGSAAIYEVNDFIAKAPVSGADHLNQIKVEAVMSAHDYICKNMDKSGEPMYWLKRCAASIAKGEL